MATTSASLLEQLRQADPGPAWGRFVALYTPLLYHWVRRAGLSANDATDLVQEVFVKLTQTLPTFHYERGRSFRAWLRTVTTNLLRDHWRGRAAPVPVEPTTLAQTAGPDAVGEWIETEYRATVARRALELMQADFQPTTWQACWEHGVLGRPAATVAAELGLSVGAVYAATFRVLARLRQELAGLLE
jgi:RNA polymerase sigma-70 factor (ECF subfamily)